MGFTEILTIVFIVLKLIGIINWSWWLVLLPEIIGLALYVLLVILSIREHKKAEKRFDERWEKFLK